MPKKKNEPTLTLQAIKEALAPSFDSIKNKLGELKGEIGSLRRDVADLFETQTVRFNKKIGALKGELVHEMTVLIDNDKRIEIATESATTASNNAVDVRELKKRVGNLESDVASIKASTKI